MINKICNPSSFPTLKTLLDSYFLIECDWYDIYLLAYKMIGCFVKMCQRKYDSWSKTCVKHMQEYVNYLSRRDLAIAMCSLSGELCLPDLLHQKSTKL